MAVSVVVLAIFAILAEASDDCVYVSDLTGESDLNKLIQNINDPDPHVREAAVSDLGNLRDARAVEPLIDALNGYENSLENVEDADARMMVAKMLGNLNDTRAVELLIDALGNDPYFINRSFAAEALGKFGDTRAVEPLIQALTDFDGSVRKFAAYAIGDLSDARSVEPLIQLLDDEHVIFLDEPQMAALEALGKIGDNRAVEPLRLLMVKFDTRDQMAIEKSINQLRGQAL